MCVFFHSYFHCSYSKLDLLIFRKYNTMISYWIAVILQSISIWTLGKIANINGCTMNALK